MGALPPEEGCPVNPLAWLSLGPHSRPEASGLLFGEVGRCGQMRT